MTVRRTLALLAGLALVAAAPAHAQDPPVVADGVTIAGLPVGGMTEAEAESAVQAFFDQPLTLHYGGTTLAVRPAAVGGRARVAPAVDAALAAVEGAALPLEVVVGESMLRRWVGKRAKQFYRPARNAAVSLRGLRPWISEAKPGRKLLLRYSKSAIRRALRTHVRTTVVLPTRALRAKITRNNFGPVVVIRRDSRRLLLYRRMTSAGMRLVRTFGVAVGQPVYPTPIGRFRIVNKRRNPWWYPPDRAWAAGASPIPPGPGNPLGTRWMGLSIGGVGIHGTPSSGSIGTAASHGCIRMRISEAEWLFERVYLGTTVFIVRA